MPDQHSVGTYIIRIGTGVASLKSKTQSYVALSSTNAEYMALCQALREAVWMTGFLQNLGVSLHGPMVINIDNQGSIMLVNNPVFHNCLKYIHIQCHYMCELIKQERSQPNHILTNNMPVDVLTKSLPLHSTLFAVLYNWFCACSGHP
jgi:hypothetical protein